MRNKIDLDFFARDYDFILVDTCALQPIDLKRDEKKNKNYSLEYLHLEKMIQEDEHAFLNFLREKGKNGSNFYFPASILPEINPISSYKFNYKKLIKRINKLENYDTELFRLIRNNRKLRRLTTDDSSGNIINLNSIEIRLYDAISDKYPYPLLKDKYNISPVDYDFLINGVVLFCTRGSTALLSNDIGIFSAMKEFKCDTNVRKFDFFLRRNFPYVERLS